MAGEYGGNYGLTQLEFDPEQDLKGFRMWIPDVAHTSRDLFPLSVWQLVEGCKYGMPYGSEMLSEPMAKGFDARIINGQFYLALIEARPDEIPEREKAYREKMKPYIDDFDGEWRKTLTEWIPVLNHFKQECHPERLKQLSNIGLYNLFEDYLPHMHRRMWAIHFYWLHVSYGIYNLFADLCQELTGIDLEHPTFKKLLGGFDNELFRINRELWQLGDRARELDLDQLFLTVKDVEELMSKLEQSDAGRKWLEEYRKFINARGWRCAEMLDPGTPTWIEQPSLGLHDVKLAIARGGLFTLDAERERRVKEREEAEKEILAKVPAEKREWFEKLMKVAERSSWFSEEHTAFLDLPAVAICRHIFREYGRRFAEAGVIDKQDDFIFLFPEEIRKAAIAMERVNLRPYVEKRREEWQRNLKAKPVLIGGDPSLMPELAWKDATMRIAMGVGPRVRPELKADLYGGSSTPGVAEGVARVIMDVRDLNQVQPGEILVAPGTSAPWTPVFGIISAVVTDGGASLSHAAIVAREFGIPAVVGTMEGTGKIKTGMKLRVDGTNNAVYILEK